MDMDTSNTDWPPSWLVDKPHCRIRLISGDYTGWRRWLQTGFTRHGNYWRLSILGFGISAIKDAFPTQGIMSSWCGFWFGRWRIGLDPWWDQ